MDEKAVLESQRINLKRRSNGKSTRNHPRGSAQNYRGGNLVAFERMDGGWIGSIDIAQKKAFTARAFDLDTKSLGENSQSGQQFFGIHASNNGKIMIFAGGIPIKRGGEVVGAIGVSGGSGKDDHAVAAAGVAAAKAGRRQISYHSVIGSQTLGPPISHVPLRAAVVRAALFPACIARADAAG